jgi:tRNA threonylcarbamoyladenosine biosynthesis protein TsaE
MIQEFSLNQINRVAKDLVSSFTYKIVLLQGDLGAGKTTLVRSLVKALGSSSSVSSPTFGIVNEYNLPNDVAFHIDLYRIEHFSALAQFGF